MREIAGPDRSNAAHGLNPTPGFNTPQPIDAPLYARVGRQFEGPLHGALVPLQQPTDQGASHNAVPVAAIDAQTAQRLRRMTVVMAALAVAGVVALGAQLLRVAARGSAPPQAQNVGAGLATAASVQARSSSSPAADAIRGR
jgi:hypothetical protein